MTSLLLGFSGACGLITAIALFRARNCIREEWSSKRIFKYMMNVVYAWAPNLLIALGLGVYFLVHQEWIRGAGFGMYFAFPFALGLTTPRYQDRTWSLPLLCAGTMAFSTLEILLAFY